MIKTFNRSGRKSLTILFLFLIVFTQTTRAQLNKVNNLRLTLKMTTAVVKKYKDFQMSVVIDCIKGNLLISDRCLIGYSDNTSSNISFEVKKLQDNGKYNRIYERGNIDDPLLVINGKQYDTLKAGKSRICFCNLYSMFQLNRGVYQIRARFTTDVVKSQFSTTAYSKWINFRVTKSWINPFQ